MSLCKTAGRLKLNVSLCCNYTFAWVEFSDSFVIACALGRSTHKNHLVRVRKTSWFSLKHLFWLPQKRPEVSTGLLTNIQWSDFGCRLVITMNNIKATVKSIESKFSECKMVYLIIFVSSSVI